MIFLIGIFEAMGMLKKYLSQMSTHTHTQKNEYLIKSLSFKKNILQFMYWVTQYVRFLFFFVLLLLLLNYTNDEQKKTKKIYCSCWFNL